jgi:AraC family transcriptional regulator, transcriptional activator of pobA
MSKNLLNFKGLYGENWATLTSDFLHHELLETRSQQYNWTIKEHFHTDLFQLFILRQGNGVLISQGQRLTLNAPCVVLIPSNTLHGFAFQSDVRGDVLTFSERFLERIWKEKPSILLKINQLQRIDFEENLPDFETITSIKEKMVQEIGASLVEKTTLLGLLCPVLFLYLYRMTLKTEQNSITSSDNRTLGYYQAFQKAIRQSIHQPKRVSEYAKQIGITPVHLNRICQSLVQKTAQHVVQEYVLEEAKKYLSHTIYTVSEIAYLLNFTDASHFSRLFKQWFGVSPLAFRKSVLKVT